MISLESKVEQFDKPMREHIKVVTQSLKEQEKSVVNQSRLREISVRELQGQKTSYSDIVRGTCSEVVEKVSATISSMPQAPASQTETRNLPGIARVFDDFLGRDRRKSDLVIHNLP